MAKRLELTGKKFGHLTVVGFLGINERKLTVWLCKCDCGNETTATSNALTSGQKRSCGHTRKNKRSHYKVKHGDSYTKLYKVWNQMKRRCINPKCNGYTHYGGRGIGVCGEWLDDENGWLTFKRWAYANGYENGLTLERVDVNGNYCPENCTWIPQSEQSNNTRRTIWIEYDGERNNIQQWSKKLGIHEETIRRRYHNGYPTSVVLQKGKLKSGKRR